MKDGPAALRRAYAEIGRSDVEITTQTVAVGDGRLNLAFVINEGGRTKIDQINFDQTRLQRVLASYPEE